MTSKEFKKIVSENLNYGFKTTYEDILSMLCDFADYKEKDFKEHKLLNGAEHYSEARDIIFKELVNRGYYNI